MTARPRSGATSDEHRATSNEPTGTRVGTSPLAPRPSPLAPLVAPPAPFRTVFLGTPAFAAPSLRALAASPAFEVALVVTQPDQPAGRGRRLTPSAVKALALELGLPVFQPARLREPGARERLAEVEADLFVIAAYGQLLRPAILALPRHGTLNVHPSLLPRHRGPAPVAATILAGDDEGGVTIMLTDAGMDTGPILARRRLPLSGRETTASLTAELAEQGAALLVETAPRWVRGEIEPQPQDEALATVSRLFTREDGAIDWSRSAVELARQVRALNPWPRAYTFHDGRRLLLLDALPLTPEEVPVAAGSQPVARSQPGTVVGSAADDLLVATADGWLRVREVQPEGRRPVSGAAFLRGTPGLVGAVLRPAPGGQAGRSGDVEDA